MIFFVAWIAIGFPVATYWYWGFSETPLARIIGFISTVLLWPLTLLFFIPWDEAHEMINRKTITLK